MLIPLNVKTLSFREACLPITPVDRLINKIRGGRVKIKKNSNVSNYPHKYLFASPDKELPLKV